MTADFNSPYAAQLHSWPDLQDFLVIIPAFENCASADPKLPFAAFAVQAVHWDVWFLSGFLRKVDSFDGQEGHNRSRDSTQLLLRRVSVLSASHLTRIEYPDGPRNSWMDSGCWSLLVSGFNASPFPIP